MAGPETVRLANELPQVVQTNSYSSPEGRTSNRRSRTGCERLHLGQYSSEAVKSPNCLLMTGAGIRQ
jgi:hypothetical protein